MSPGVQTTEKKMKIVHERGVEANLNFYFYFDLLIQTSDRIIKLLSTFSDNKLFKLLSCFSKETKII